MVVKFSAFHFIMISFAFTILGSTRPSALVTKGNIVAFGFYKKITTKESPQSTDQLLLEKTTKEKHSTLPAFKRASLCKVFCEMLAINWVRHHSGLVRRTGPLDRRQFSDISADLGFQGG